VALRGLRIDIAGVFGGAPGTDRHPLSLIDNYFGVQGRGYGRWVLSIRDNTNTVPLTQTLTVSQTLTRF